MKQTIKKYMEDASPKSDSPTPTSDDEKKGKRKSRIGSLFHVSDAFKDQPRKSFLEKQSSLGNIKTLQASGSLPKVLAPSLSTGEPIRTFYIICLMVCRKEVGSVKRSGNSFRTSARKMEERF